MNDSAARVLHDAEDIGCADGPDCKRWLAHARHRYFYAEAAEAVIAAAHPDSEVQRLRKAYEAAKAYVNRRFTAPHEDAHPENTQHTLRLYEELKQAIAEVEGSSHEPDNPQGVWCCVEHRQEWEGS